MRKDGKVEGRGREKNWKDERRSVKRRKGVML